MFSLIPWRGQQRRSRQLQARDDFFPTSIFHNRISDLFDRFFSDWPSLETWAFEGWMGPAAAFQETDDSLKLRLEAPGFETNEFDIRVAGNTVSVEAEHRESEGTESQPVNYRQFRRVFRLPAEVVPDQVDARYRNGILELTFRKADSARWRKVEVKGG